MTATTPVRSSSFEPPSDIDAEAHPFAARLLAMVSHAQDRSSSSDELELACTDWSDRYHVSSTRANVVRVLPQHPDAVVLEVGAGAGAVTRFLGETYATVDALETDPRLATVAAVRCADLASVRVHAAWIDDVPDTPAYDLIVALDVLHEVRRRGGDLTAFVARCRSLLVPGGTVVLGADNVDGVRFVAGDATPVVRPGDGRAPRVSRDELERAVRSAGLAPRTLSAFPDHRTARVVFDHDGLAAVAPSLLGSLPSFPSPPYDPPRAPGFLEEKLWSEAVAAGSGARCANSFVVVASDDQPADPTVATYWSIGRRAALSATNQVVRDDVTEIRRSLTFPDAAPVEGPLSVRPHAERLLEGRGLTAVLGSSTDLDEVTHLLRDWSTLVERSAVDGDPVPWDLIPRNVLLAPDGSLAAFDQEWQLEPTTGSADLVRTRGAFWLAYDLLYVLGRPAWLSGRTVGAAADFILRLADPATRSDWLRDFVGLEAEHMSHVWPTTRLHPQSARARKERNSVSSLSNSTPPDDSVNASPIEDSASLREVVESLTAANADLRAQIEALHLEQRHAALAHRDHAVGLVAESETVHERLARAQRESRRNKDRALKLQKQVTSMRSSATWRVGGWFVRPLAAIRRKLGR